MCGRFAQSIPPGKLMKIDLFDEIIGAYSENYNLAPSREAFTVYSNGAKKIMKPMKWGLIPSWTKSGMAGSGLINARFESINEKPSFRNSYRMRRCIIPAAGFFEWRKEDKLKIPYFINCGRDNDGDFIPMLLCGLYDLWKSPEGEAVETFTIITTEASAEMKTIHDRMPLILDRTNIELWLGKNYLHDAHSDIIKSFDAESLIIYRVPETVNSPVNNSPQCLVPSGE